MISKLRLRVISEVQITLCSWSMVLLMFILTCVSDHPLCAKHSTSKQWEWDEAEWDRPFPAEDLRVIEGTQTGMGITQEKRGRRHRKKRDTLPVPSVPSFFSLGRNLRFYIHGKEIDTSPMNYLNQMPPFLSSYFRTFIRGKSTGPIGLHNPII